MTSRFLPSLRGAALAAAVLGAVAPAHAGLFDDNEARKAILELRAKVDEHDRQNVARQTELAEAVAVFKRSLLELNSQLESLRGELARLRGQDEQTTAQMQQLAKDIAALQQRQKDMLAPLEERLGKLEPMTVKVDGKDAHVMPDEKKSFDEAMAVMRTGDFNAAVNAFERFQRRYPASAYVDVSNYWLGNAQYGRREYKEAIQALRNLLSSAPEHPRAAEALLLMANCQLELKDGKAARKTLEDLLKAFPNAEVAAAAKERLAAIK